MECGFGKVNMADEINWHKIKHFTPKENWGDVSKISPVLVYQLDDLREYVGKPVHIHKYAYETTGHKQNSYHGMGAATDGHIEGLSLLEQFLALTRFFGEHGIGLYTWWNNPGFHVDVRPYPARWASVKKGEYISLNEDFIRKII